MFELYAAILPSELIFRTVRIILTPTELPTIAIKPLHITTPKVRLMRVRCIFCTQTHPSILCYTKIVPCFVVTFVEIVISGCQVQNYTDKIILRMRNMPEIPPTSAQRKLAEPLRETLAPYSIGYRIKLLGQLGSRRFQERLEPFGLTPFHWVVLCCLWEEDGLATCSIGEKLQQVGGTLTGVLDRMEERGLIRRERDPRDRRIWRIWLTTAGRELEDILLPIALELKEQAMQGFSTEERQLFSRLVDRAIANLA